MKYSIYINQFCWVINDFRSLDITDLALFDFIKSFMLSDKCETIVYERQQYHWINPSTIIKEMPILGITTTRGINKRIDNLISAGLLERCPNNQSNQKTYLKTGARYNLYECYHPNESSSLGTSVPSTWNECSNNNNIIDKNINKKEFEETLNTEEETRAIPLPPSSATPLPLKYPYTSQEFMEWWDKLIHIKRWKGKDAGQLQFSLNKLSKISEKDAIECIKASYENGWQGLFTDKYKAKVAPTTTTPKPKKPIWEDMGFNSYEEYKKTILK